MGLRDRNSQLPVVALTVIFLSWSLCPSGHQSWTELLGLKTITFWGGGGLWHEADFPATQMAPEGSWRLSWQVSEPTGSSQKRISEGSGPQPNPAPALPLVLLPLCHFSPVPSRTPPPRRFQCCFCRFVITPQLPGLRDLSPHPSPAPPPPPPPAPRIKPRPTRKHPP